MPPDYAIFDSADGALINAIMFADNPLISAGHEYLHYLPVCQFGENAFFSSRWIGAVSLLAKHIFGIVRRRPKKQVINIATGRIVATVQDPQTFRDRTFRENPCGAMRAGLRSIIKGKGSVWIFAFPLSDTPVKAPSRRVESKVRCEPLDRRNFRVDSFSHLHALLKQQVVRAALTVTRRAARSF